MKKNPKNLTSRKPKKNSIRFTRGLSEIETKFANAVELQKLANVAISSLVETLQLAGTPETQFSSATGVISFGGIETRLKQMIGLWDILAKNGLTLSRKEVEKYMIHQISQKIIIDSKKNWKGKSTVC